jgi:hypothetical protein
MPTDANSHHLGPLTVLLMLASVPAGQACNFAGGTGEPNDPYRIATAEQLISIGSDPNLLDKHFVLVNDIDLDPNLPGGRVFTQAVIAPDTDLGEGFQGTVFTGSFDGNSHVIRNLIMHNEADSLDDDDYLGLFGNVGERAVVKDLGIETADVGERYGEYHGGLAGWNEGRIIRCHTRGCVSGRRYIGGLVGQNLGDIHDCRADSDWVSGKTDIGGLVGRNYFGARIVRCHGACTVFLTECGAGGLVGLNEGYVISCHAASDVLGAGYGVYTLGGLAGSNLDPGIIMNCYAAGNISIWEWGIDYGFGEVGGLVGGVYGGSIVNCYATGRVSGGHKSDSLGGLVGSARYGCIVNAYATAEVTAGGDSRCLGGLVGERTGPIVIQASFWNIETSALPQSDGGTGLTTAEMQDVQTFLAAGWDFAGERSNGSADVWLPPQGGKGPTLAILSDEYAPPELVGSGTSDDPYRIGTAEDLGAINHYDLTACYRLETDVNLAGIVWNQAPIPYFDGKFDGAGRILSNLQSRGGTRLGLFGDLGQQASVSDLGMQNATVTGISDLGSLAGMNRGRITACYANGAVAGTIRLGGLVGWNEGTIADSYATGAVSVGSGWEGSGGLTGGNYGTIRRCYAAAHVSWSSWSHCYSDDFPGGLVGANYDYVMGVTGEIHDSCFLIDSDGGGPDNGLATALTDAQMRQQTSFAGWDFESIWMICEGRDYPRLRWEGVQCEP